MHNHAKVKILCVDGQHIPAETFLTLCNSIANYRIKASESYTTARYFKASDLRFPYTCIYWTYTWFTMDKFLQFAAISFSCIWFCLLDEYLRIVEYRCAQLCINIQHELIKGRIRSYCNLQQSNENVQKIKSMIDYGLNFNRTVAGGESRTILLLLLASSWLYNWRFTAEQD